MLSQEASNALSNLDKAITSKGCDIGDAVGLVIVQSILTLFKEQLLLLSRMEQLLIDINIKQ